MIHGYKANGYSVTTDGSGRKIEGETRQCVHCQFIWDYVPGSGRQRGWCIGCQGIICARPECIAEQQRLTAGTHLHCLPFEERNKRIEGKLEKGLPIPEMDLTNYQVTQSGIIIKP
jgi:hypothetical protein